MGVNAQMRAGHMFDHLRNNIEDFAGQGAAIGVAQDHPAGPARMRRPHTIKRKFRVVLKAIAVDGMLSLISFMIAVRCLDYKAVVALSRS